MAAFDPLRFRWPIPWKPLVNDSDALVFGRMMNPAIADTVLGELRREVCHPQHLLFNVPYRPVAFLPARWDSTAVKDFLFLTARRDMPLASVHFTWGPEDQFPAWPCVIPYRDLPEFLRRERRWALEVRVRIQRWWARVKQSC